LLLLRASMSHLAEQQGAAALVRVNEQLVQLLGLVMAALVLLLAMTWAYLLALVRAGA
jgi:hypothetical protein